jgi:hypothetical protein
MYLEMDNHATKQFHHIYSKENKVKRRIKKVMKLRDAIQEYPNKPLEVVFMDKLKDEDYKSNKTFSIGLL